MGKNRKVYCLKFHVKFHVKTFSFIFYLHSLYNSQNFHPSKAHAKDFFPANFSGITAST